MVSKLLNFNHRLSVMSFASVILTVILIITLFPLRSEAQNKYRSIGDIPLPQGYRRLFQPSNSFGAWLRKIPLKSSTTVYLYDGRRKFNQSAQYAVLDISVGKKDLQQCADAVMRLRAEYLKKMGMPICFSDNARRAYCWHPSAYRNWEHYLETVFAWCGTLSLNKQLRNTQWSQLQPGDVLIVGGSPGHAVIVADVAVHTTTGKMIYLLAQSYMPAQDIHILKNPSNDKLSPWYEVNDNEYIVTPEWTFRRTQLKTW